MNSLFTAVPVIFFAFIGCSLEKSDSKKKVSVVQSYSNSWTCVVDAVNTYTDVSEKDFIADDSSGEQACRSAKDKCKDYIYNGLASEKHECKIRNGFPAPASRPPYDRPVETSCTVDAIDTYTGSSVRDFVADGDSREEACDQAKDHCKDYIYNGLGSSTRYECMIRS